MNKKPKKKASKSPTQLTLAYFRKLGFKAAVVERWNPFARIRQDLFGCIDIIAMHPTAGIVGVQACAGDSHAARLAKVKAQPLIADWMAAGGRMEVVSWRKSAESGRWVVRREELGSTAA